MISTTKAICRCRRWKPRSSRRCWRRSTRSPTSTRNSASCRTLRVEAALASDELSTGQERRFKKLRNETIDLVKCLKLNNNRIEALVDQMYGINRRLVSLEGKLLRLAEAHGVDRADFLKQHFGNELDPNWARRVGRLSRPRLA